MADDGAAQDEAVSGGPGQGMPRSLSPLPSASNVHPDPLMPVAENWCHTQVRKIFYLCVFLVLKLTIIHSIKEKDVDSVFFGMDLNIFEFYCAVMYQILMWNVSLRFLASYSYIMLWSSLLMFIYLLHFNLNTFRESSY
uniref:XK-related protein n=1 Tax=Heterorhabditis bacteriophora TaxID=37862 RepID=A0A1I7WET2_HETBA